MALGRPGRHVMATLGIVSAIGEGWRTPAGGLLEGYVQPDTAMYPGFSGGPLVDVAGRFVGMNTSALARGMALTVATPTLRRVVEVLLAHGRVRRAYLGIGAQTGRLPASIAQQAGQDTAVLLVSVEAGSPADRGGLLLGDAVLAVDGHPVRVLDDLLTLLTGDLVGQRVSLRVLRAGQLQDIALVVGERG
jgi:S1-C subfamily serine protease